jgi:hypothetical protein
MMIFKKSRIRSEASALPFNNVTDQLKMVIHTMVLRLKIGIGRKERFRTRGTSFPLATLELSV